MWHCVTYTGLYSRLYWVNLSRCVDGLGDSSIHHRCRFISASLPSLLYGGVIIPCVILQMYKSFPQSKVLAAGVHITVPRGAMVSWDTLCLSSCYDVHTVLQFCSHWHLRFSETGTCPGSAVLRTEISVWKQTWSSVVWVSFSDGTELFFSFKS